MRTDLAHRKRVMAGALWLVLVAGARGEDAKPDPLTDVADIAPVREWFEAHREEPRIVLFLSPV